jgi:hypothetical protein
MDKHTLRICLILLFGLLTPILTLFIPVSIGGNGFIFIITSPLLILMSVVFSIIYHYLNKKIIKEINKTYTFYVFIGILTLLAFISYPYNQY